MDRQKKTYISALEQEALEQLRIVCNDVDNDSDNDSESASSSETESIADDDELPMQEQLSDIDVYEEETEDDGNNEDQDPNDDEASSEDEDQVAITARNATYYDTAFPSRLRRRNILTQQPRIIASPENEVDAFKIFYQTDIIFHIIRETNRKARDVRRKYNLLPNSVYKNLTSQEVEAGLAIMIRAGYDRDNFTDLSRLWDSIGTRPFYRVTMALNLFKFFCAACVSIIIVIDQEDKETLD